MRFTKHPSTPDEVVEFINRWDVYRRDATDLSFKVPEELAEQRNYMLQRQIQLVAEGSPYYQRIFREHRIDPQRIKTVDDLEQLPLTFKHDYMAQPEDFRLKFANPGPYEQFYDVTFTTGTTTGRPTPFYNTTHDHFRLLLGLQRMMKISCVTPKDVVANAFPLGIIPHIGYFRMTAICSAIGAAVVFGNTGTPYAEAPVHRSLTELIELIEVHRCTVLAGIGSYLRRLIVEAERQGRDFSCVRMVLAMGEAVPRGMRDDMRRRLQNIGAKDVLVFNPYGATEFQASFVECVEFSGVHNYDPGLYYVEIVDEKTGKRLPDGETGLVALTHLDRRGTVLIRYILGDIAAMTRERCPHCGRYSERLITKVGSTYATRTKELVKLKGTLINPEIIKNEVANVPGVLEYQIVFTKRDPGDPYSPDELVIRVAVSASADRDFVEKAIVDRVLLAAEMRCRVEFVADPSEIFDPMKTLKATRVVDLRLPEE